MKKQRVQDRLKELPKTPGVYLHKDGAGEVVYVGKAANLRNRVRSYFQNSRQHDSKTRALIADIADIDWLETDSEINALFLESELIKRYQPKYNVDLRDNKSFLYVKFTNDEFPRVWLVRRPLDDGAEYFGPYTSAFGLRRAMRQLRRSFPYVTHRQLPDRGCLHHHIGLCPGPEAGAITPQQYRQNLKQIKRYLRGGGATIKKELERQMKRHAKAHEFEAAARVRNQLQNLESLSRQHIFGDKELFDLARDQAVVDLQQLLSLQQPPRRIECYDVSHIQGTHNTASMVVFTDGVPDRGQYRKFRLRQPGNDDYGHMREVLQRRLQRWQQWPQPEVIIIDGGRGQVAAAQQILNEHELNIPLIGLAKRFERIIVADANAQEYHEYELSDDSHLLKLLQHIRDEAHRFAVTYHSQLRSRQQTASVLESIPGVGPATRKKLIRQFGSLRGIEAADEDSLAAVVGAARARAIKAQLTSR